MVKEKRVSSNFIQRQTTFIVATVFWLSQYIYIPFQTAYLSKIGVNTASIGIIIGAYGFLQLILRMPVGIMADRNGQHKSFIMIGVTSACIASVFRFFMTDGMGFLVGNIFSGLASTMWISFMVLYFSYFPKNQLQNASGRIIAANNLGILISFIIGALLYDHFGMKLLCLLSSLAAFLAILLSFNIENPNKNSDKPSVRELMSVYADKRLIVFSLLALIQQGVQISTAMSFTTQVAQSLGANGVQIGVCSIIYILVALVSACFAASKAAERQGAKLWIPSTLICLASYCFIIPNLTSVYWIYLTQILSGLSTGILFSFCTSEAMRSIPEGKKSTAMGFYQSVFALGMTFFPVLTGKLIDVFNIHAAFYCLACIAAIGAIGSAIFYNQTNFTSYPNECGDCSGKFGDKQ